ncbi:MAG: nickel pincer cofactor biosynthesis protein LarC [Phycisphaerales bacterium]|nr:nickel pincer cofactor biosynthesis protein LarC [Phycisphaerales bacterium]
MTIAYFDCFSGIAGDMILGALVDAGLPADELRAAVGGLPISGYQIAIERVTRHGISATRVDVQLDASTPQPHRHLSHVLKIIDGANLTDAVKTRAAAVFRRLAEAEARVHGTNVEKIHFHEVGAVDAIIDVVGAMWGLDRLGVQRVVGSPVPTGHGTVSCEHGVMPVPAPATALLLQGVPLAACNEPGELTTPTGAAILTELADSYGPIPAMTLERVGVGAGSRQGQHRPNVFRLLLGRVGAAHNADCVVVLEANVDDATPEILGHTLDGLLDAGALDAYILPIQMKKSRPGAMITALAEPDRVARIEEVLFAETTTFGIRRHEVLRTKLERTFVTVQTRFGPIRIKEGRSGDRVITASPEFEDCRKAAEEHNAPLREVMNDATHAWHHRH